MTGYLHRKITYEACREAGFSVEDSEKIANYCVNFDSIKIFKPFAHFKKFGAAYISIVFFKLAALTAELRFLGYSLHSLQDSISHGNIYPWQHRRYQHLDMVKDVRTYRQVYDASVTLAKKYLARRKNG